jgi:hypothetical protein
MTRLLKQNIRRTSLHICKNKWVFLWLGLRREKIEKCEVLYMADFHMDKLLTTNIERKLSRHWAVGCSELLERILQIVVIKVWIGLI